MCDLEQKQIFSKNLLFYLNHENKSQKEVADAIGVSPQTFNTWCQGIALPRMGKVQKLADYFGIEKSNLIEDKSIKEDSYYLNKETSQIAQEIFEKPQLKILFDITKDCSSEDMKRLISIIKAFKGEL